MGQKNVFDLIAGDATFANKLAEFPDSNTHLAQQPFNKPETVFETVTWKNLSHGQLRNCNLPPEKFDAAYATGQRPPYTFTFDLPANYNPERPYLRVWSPPLNVLRGTGGEEKGITALMKVTRRLVEATGGFIQLWRVGDSFQPPYTFTPVGKEAVSYNDKCAGNQRLVTLVSLTMKGPDDETLRLLMRNDSLLSAWQLAFNRYNPKDAAFGHVSVTPQDAANWAQHLTERVGFTQLGFNSVNFRNLTLAEILASGLPRDSISYMSAREPKPQ